MAMYAIKDNKGKWFSGFYFKPFPIDNSPIITDPTFSERKLMVLKKKEVKKVLKELEQLHIKAYAVKLIET